MAVKRLGYADASEVDNCLREWSNALLSKDYEAACQIFRDLLRPLGEGEIENKRRRYLGHAASLAATCVEVDPSSIFERGFGRARCPKCCQEFLVPKRLRVFFRYDRRLLGELAACAWRAVRLYFKVYYDDEAVVPGAVGFIAAAGEFLNWMPHIHILLTDGGFLPDGTFRHLLYFDSDKVEELFRAEVLRLLLKKQLIDEQAVNNMLSWRHSGFSVDATVRGETIRDAVRIGRYMIRCPLVLKRLQWDEEHGEVVYAARPSRAKGPFGGVVRWDVLEFIARVTDHILLSAALRRSPRNI